MDTLAAHLENHLQVLQSNAVDSPVQAVRSLVSEACKTAADLEPGFFSLSVPTGGGKTLASLRFALNHARTQDMQGVIIAIPFTSIIEQNAKVYKNVFEELGGDIVLEHHSNLDPKNETTTNRLQAENWDAPIVVSTNVQFFESMFAARTSRCRKLHRFARRVIILDEVQTLPVELLKPTLLALRELVESYGCTVVLCTATQPAVERRDDFPIGLTGIRPIIDRPGKLHERLKRVKVQFVGTLENDAIAERILDSKQSLCIVNTRPHAVELFESIGDDDGHIHLSTRMCAAHRQWVFDREIRPRLKEQKMCRVVSTQLIEAGVDIDFPVVFRAICGLDSLTQAAGRCNREGLLDVGMVYFFNTVEPPPVGMLRQSADCGRELLSQFDDLLSPDAVNEFFRLHYWKKSDSWDRCAVLEPLGRAASLMQFNFREVANRYQFIRAATESVLVPWGDGKQWVNRLNNPLAHFDRADWRTMQRYSVQVRDHELRRLQQTCAVELMHERYVLIHEHLYDDNVGLQFERADGVLPVEGLCC